jgi:hypothetical protein
MRKADSTTQDVRDEMAKPRMARSARIAELKMDTARTSAAPGATLPGTVDQIIPPGPSEPEKAQITVEGADRRHREEGPPGAVTPGGQAAQIARSASDIASRETTMANPLLCPVWQTSYVAAMLEMNGGRVRAKIAAAEGAIYRRMVSSRVEPQERQAILLAMNALKFLNRRVR